MSAAGHLAAPPLPTRAALSVLHDRLLHLTLFITVLASSFVFIEPSPHDVLMGALAIACLIAGVRFDIKLAPLLVMLAVWNGGLAASLLNVAADSKAFIYAATSLYLSIAALLFACLFSQDSVRRLNTMKNAYILTALVATALGIVGYFNLLPGAEKLFAPIGRASGAFKDPNVFGPFIILPILFLLEKKITRGMRLHEVAIVFALLAGLFFSFSRGAWIHFAISGVVLLTLLFLTGPTVHARARVIAFGIATIAAIAVLAASLISIDGVSQMFAERAHALQYYDVGDGGRFYLQKLALQAMVDFPNGMGPYAFQRTYGSQQHNVYLQTFLVYGWIGGVTYLALVFLTLFVGLHTVFIATPWRPYLICAVATFVGEMVEGIVVDTDHWRHFFLLLGMIWGMSVATLNAKRAATGRSVRHVAMAP